MKNMHEKNFNDQWEDRKLGASAKHVRKSDKIEEKNLDDTLDLQLISIRLQKNLIKTLKRLAGNRGIGYQPYIRQILTQHANGAAKNLIELDLATK